MESTFYPGVPASVGQPYRCYSGPKSWIRRHNGGLPLSLRGDHCVAYKLAGGGAADLRIGCAASSCKILSSASQKRLASDSEKINGGLSLITLWCGPSVPARMPHSRIRLTT